MATVPKLYGSTLIDQIVWRARITWVQFIVGAGAWFVGALGIAGYLDQDFRFIADPDLMRVYLTAPAVILYILVVYYLLGVKSSGATLRALQRLLGLDTPAFLKLLVPDVVAHRRQWWALGAGLIVGLVLSPPWQTIARFTWLNVYLWLNQMLMMAWLGLIIYLSLAEARQVNRLQQLPMQIDLFDTTQFEALGRASLITTLMMLGGSTLVVIILPARFLMNVFTIALIAGTVFIAIAAFFFNLRGTHRIMVAAKRRELKTVREKLAAAFADLKTHGAPANPEAVRVWLAYEERLEKVPEWPFNTETLSSLIFSVFIPTGAFIGRWFLGQL